MNGKRITAAWAKLASSASARSSKGSWSSMTVSNCGVDIKTGGASLAAWLFLDARLLLDEGGGGDEVLDQAVLHAVPESDTAGAGDRWVVEGNERGGEGIFLKILRLWTTGALALICCLSSLEL